MSGTKHQPFVVLHKHLSLMATAHMPWPNKGITVPWSKHHALSCQNRALAWKLPQISLFSPSQWCQASSIPKSIFSLTSQHHRVTHKPAVPPGLGARGKAELPINLLR